MTDFSPGDLVEVTATRERWTVDEAVRASGMGLARLVLGRSEGDSSRARGIARDVAPEDVTLVCRAVERTAFPGSAE